MSENKKMNDSVSFREELVENFFSVLAYEKVDLGCEQIEVWEKEES